MKRLLLCGVLAAGQMSAQTTLLGSTTDMRGASCTPGTGTNVAIAVYLAPAPSFGYTAQLRFCDPKTKLWFPLTIATNAINGESLTLFKNTQYPNGAAALSRTPISVSMVTRNGLAMKQGVEFSFTGNVINFLVPTDQADSLQAWYSY